MPDLFADTSGWGNLVDPTQPYHAQAAAVYRAARRDGRMVVTTNYVIVELVALMTRPLRIPRPRMIEFIESLRTSPCIRIVNVDAMTDEQAWQMLRSRQDKEWSLTDCASFAVMTQRGIHDALTTDQHFEQAGFTRLLK